MAKNDTDLVGTRIREYEILELIGKGGMGAVYKARHIYLDEERAIKVIENRLSEDENFVDRFIREAKILTKLRHPNLVQIYEFGTLDENTFFMVLDLLRGESVRQRLRREGNMPVHDAIRIILEAAQGLHIAHEKGIVHRDISPDNLVLVKGDGVELTKVIDFGIAKPLFETARETTATNLFMGKPEYCSPEQCGLLEEGEIIDRRSDIYSLAVCLYEMLCGKLPFYATSPQGYILKHANETPPRLSTHFPSNQIPEALERFLQKALAKKRTDRFATMEEFGEELSKIIVAEQATLDVFPGRAEPLRLHAGHLFAKRYVIEKKLGEGGMGVVYKAIDRMLEIPVALKIMSPKIAHTPKTLERFKREVILARKVAHRNVCRIYDIGESDGVHYVSMEFLEGKILSEILEQGPLSFSEGLSLLKQVLIALQEAHRAGVIHRDLKPQNIMVDPEGRACIMDFGISISADTDRITQTDALVGTPLYMSPEQLENKKIDQRTDIYSIGMILYQIFTGELPFKDVSTPAAVIVAHLKTDPQRPSDRFPDFPPELERIILKALAKKPQSRYQTIADLIHDLEMLDRPYSARMKWKRNLPFVALLLLVAGWIAWSTYKPAVTPQASTSRARPSPPPTAVIATVPVSIVALPWARVNVESATIPDSEKVTPCYLSLPPGDYVLHLSNDSTVLEKKIKVESGASNSFLFTMPAYNVDQIVSEMEAHLE